MRINYNVSAMVANNALANNDSLLAASIARLSSGYKINSAGDNPAGLAMAKRMNAQIRGLGDANQNANDGISVIETADGAMAEVSEMLQRMNELAVKASNGPMTSEEREVIQHEVAALKSEIQRISTDTEFNGQPILDGTYQSKGYTSEISIKVASYSEEVVAKEYTISGLTIADVPDKNGKPTGELALVGCTLGPDFPADAVASMSDNYLTIKSSDGSEIKLDVDRASAGTYTDLKVDIKGMGAMRLQIGANEGQVLSMDIPTISLRAMGVDDLDVSTYEGAQKAITSISSAIDYVSSARGRLGAYENRLDSTVNGLDATSENLTAAYSRIMDVDMADEMTTYSTGQVLTQVGTSMLAQANNRPSQVLQLLQ